MNFKVLGAGIILLLIQITVNGQTCAKGWTLLGSNCYYIDQKNLVTWLGAKERCNSLNATLSIQDSVTVNNLVGNQLVALGTSQQFWIGLYDQGHEGTYTWVGLGRSTSQIGFANWASTPKTNNTINCAATGTGSIKNQWQNLACSTTLGYICQRPLTLDQLSCQITVDDICPTHSGWLSVQGTDLRCYYTNITAPELNFIKAQETCAQSGFSLAVFETAQAWGSFVAALPRRYAFNSYNFWIGLYDQGHEGIWYGSPTGVLDCSQDFTSVWTDDTPEFDTTKNCAIMESPLLSSSYSWTPTACSETHRYFCEIPPKCITG